jgi:hypothetical protein
MLSLLLVGMLTLAFGTVPVEAETITESEPSVEVIDFNNGTTLIIFDYHNGTTVEGRRTYYPGKGSLQPLEGSENQSFRVDIPIVEGGNQCINDPSISRDILFGFTWNYDIIPTWSDRWEKKLGPIVVASAELEVGLGFGIGLRLPARITLDYPETMLSNTDYTVNATLETIDWTDWDELMLYLHCGARLSADVVGLKGEWTIGPWFDRSESFETPLGPDVSIPLPAIGPFELVNLGIEWLGGISLGFSIVPTCYCNRIEAVAEVGGNVSIIGSSFMIWNASGEKVPISIHTANINESGLANVSIHDFKYVIDQFLFDFDFVIDPYGLLGWIQDYEFTFLTWDVSDFFPDLILGVHPGYPKSIGVNMFVERAHEPFLHDLAITNVTTSSHAVYQGELVQVFVTAENEGNTTETFTVIAYYSNKSIGTRVVEDLPAGENASLVFNWDTKDVAQGYWYNIKAEASIIAGEKDIANNLYFDGAVKIRCVGDVNDDGIVNIQDIVIAALAFGSAAEDDSSTPWNETRNWNPIADLNGDGKVNIIDLVIIGVNFGKTL